MKDTGPTTYQLGDEPPVCSGPGCRQNSGSLHSQRSKARGDTVPSDALLLQQAVNMAAGILSLCWSPGRTQAPQPTSWEMNHLCAQVLGTGRPLGCRQTPSGLHPQRSKARGDTVPSKALLPKQAANMTVGILSICCFPGRRQAPCPAVWQLNHLYAQFLGAGRSLVVFTPRYLKLRCYSN